MRRSSFLVAAAVALLLSGTAVSVGGSIAQAATETEFI